MKIQTDIYEEPGVLDSEEIVDKAYEGMVAIMDLRPKKILTGRQFGGGHLAMNQFRPVVDGLYYCGSTRSIYIGYFDVGVDAFPESGCVYRRPNYSNRFEYTVVKKIARLPKRIWNVCRNPAAIYEITHCELIYGFSEAKFGDRDRSLNFEVLYLQIAADGSIYGTQDPKKRAEGIGKCDFYNAQVSSSGALSQLADRKYLWLVQSEEDFETTHKVKAQFGIDQEYIKSLFYARSLPLTASGRKRPILHWVRAHKRRLQSGINIDVIKHMRGIEQFTMGDLNFRITQPKKTPQKAA